MFADKYINWIDALPQEEQVINIFMELSALGMVQPLSSNILEFLKALPYCAKEKGITFSTPTEIVTKLKSVSQLDVPYPISWVDEERDTSCWLGNVMQREAFNKLYSVAERVHMSDDRRIKQKIIPVHHPRQSQCGEMQQFVCQIEHAEHNQRDSRSLIGIFIVICFRRTHRYFPPYLLR